jgi:transposase
VAHANARTTVYARKLMVWRHQAGWPQARIAEQLGVSRPTVAKWISRHRAEGWAGLVDRSSRPRSTPTRTDPATEAQILALRDRERRGAVFLAGELGLVASTVGRVLHRHGVPHLSAIDPITGAPVRRQHSGIRYERPRPGDLLHIDVKKLGRVPDGGGWRLHGRREDVRGRGNGYDFLHVAVDDRSRVAYIEALPDERDLTCAGFLHRAVTWFRRHGVRVLRILTDNAKVPRRQQLAGRVRRVGDPAPVHQTGLSVDQRESRAAQPDPAHRVRLRPTVAVQHRPAHRPGRMGTPLQHSTRPLRPRRPSPHHPTRRMTVNNVSGQYT